MNGCESIPPRSVAASTSQGQPNGDGGRPVVVSVLARDDGDVGTHDHDNVDLDVTFESAENAGNVSESGRDF